MLSATTTGAKTTTWQRRSQTTGGFFGVAAIAGFIRDDTNATLDDFADHVEHLVDVMGIDHVGIGSDKCGPGPGTETMFEFPPELGPFSTSFLFDADADARARPSGLRLARLPSGAQAERPAQDARLRPAHRLAEHHGQAGRARVQRG